MKATFVKPLLVVAIMSLLVMMTACGGTKPAQEASKPAGESGATEEKQKLFVGTEATFAPFEFLQKGEVVGFDVDLTKAIMEELGYDYEIKNVGWEPLFASVKSGEINVGMSGITITDERKQSYDFSNPYYESALMIMFPEGAPITNAKDLMDKKVGVQISTTGAIATEKILGDKAASNMKNYENIAVAIMAMKNGEVDAVVTDNSVAQEYLKKNPNDKFIAINDPENFESEFYGFMFQKGNPLKAEYDNAIKKVIESGKYAEIYKQWFGTEPNVDALLQK